MSKKPNFITILMDDMGWTDLSYCGSDFYESPNIDALRARGMTFTRAYASCPVCSPSRASFLTGKYPATLGLTDWISHAGTADGKYVEQHDPTKKRSDIQPCKGKLIDAPYIKHLPDGHPTLAELLRADGYATWHVGKWHLGTEEYYPEKKGFDVNLGGCFWGKARHGYHMPCNIPTLENGPDGEFLTDRLTDEAIKLIRNRDKSKPFMLDLWYYSVHVPIDAKPDQIEYFKEKAKRMGLDQKEAFEEGEFYPVEHKKDQRVLRRLFHSDPDYAALIYNVDINVGKLVSALEKEGLMEDTVIVFTSDNGGLATSMGSPTCNAPAKEGKGWIYDGGTRVPSFVVWKDHIRAGSSCDAPTTTPDYFPTYLELAGVKNPEDNKIDGVSLASLWNESAELTERPIFWHYPHYSGHGGTPGASVILGRYKLIQFFEEMEVELYDLIDDVSESHNLRDEMPEKAEEMLALLHDWQNSIEVMMPERNPDFVPWR